MPQKRIGRIFFIIIIGFLFFIAYSAYSIWSFSSKNELVMADAAIVLGAAAWDDEPSPVLRERINHAIWLYDNGYAEKLIFTGGKNGEDRFAESEVAREYAINNNVKAEDILIETKSAITEENLKYAIKVAFDHHLETFLIVSDPLHMKRAMLMTKNDGVEAYPSPTQSSVYTSLETKIPFFFRELFFYIGYIISLPFR
ncbi:YdcF family protein [Bacillus sp. ISL-47]|uniref:YdcF family protein n=1 Tax=Bacillus sp. ISL-47 TaxID=2819130 RepID=UPI001BE7F96E|nr:YdcF family protein [Bacillus sp. ISL-47]MBT2690754.1 YdcF family protein [Bacillus sp. ISL-47]MBT2709698.1 YdcF family protein [Pseudomonas sp. ISL-84]